MDCHPNLPILKRLTALLFLWIFAARHICRGLFGPPTHINFKVYAIFNELSNEFNLRDINACLTRGIFKMKLKICILIFLLLILPITILADIDIVVQKSDKWPERSTEDIKLMATTLILQFQKYLRYENKIRERNINIQYGGPRIEYRNWDPNTDFVFLSVSGEWWQEQLFYQFGHEFCHILHNHSDFGVNHPNKWFYESICMMASIWVMNDMSGNWLDISPKREWDQWGEWIKIYADTNKDRKSTQFEGTAEEWLNKFEQFLRDDANNTFTHHLLVAQLSYKFFLPIFEENPEAWNAVRQMPVSNQEMSVYMKEWYNNVDTQDKQFVSEIAQIMGISVGGSITASIDADINNDGYVDLSDVLIVRSAINHKNSYDTDVNDDGTTNEIDVLLVKAKAMEAIAAAAPSLIRRKKITTWGALKQK